MEDFEDIEEEVNSMKITVELGGPVDVREGAILWLEV